jgi:hypothetical protein
MEKKNMNEVSKKKKKFAKIHTRKEIMKKQTRKKMNDCEDIFERQTKTCVDLSCNMSKLVVTC